MTYLFDNSNTSVSGPLRVRMGNPCCPAWFMRDLHINTPKTLQDFRNLGARFATNPGARDVAFLALLARGWDPNKPLDGVLSLYDVLLRKELGILETLVRVGANPMLTGSTGVSLLFQAVLWNDVEAIKPLLASPHADPLAKENGQTLLHPAASNGSIPVMEMLVTAGVDPWEPDEQGQTAYDVLSATWAKHASERHAFRYQSFADGLKQARAVALMERFENRLFAATASASRPRM